MQPRPSATQILQRPADATARIIWDLVLVRNLQRIEKHVYSGQVCTHVKQSSWRVNAICEHSGKKWFESVFYNTS